MHHPIQISDFEERSRFYQAKWKTEKVELTDELSFEKSEIARENPRKFQVSDWFASIDS